MRRRGVLAAAGSITGALAGCSNLGGSDGGSGGPGAPTEPVETAIAAYENDSLSQARRAAHPGGSYVREIDEESLTTRSVTLENATVVDRTESNATVRAVLAIESETASWTERRAFDLRIHDGAWRIWAERSGEEIAAGTYARALAAGDLGTARETLHPDAPDRDWLDETFLSTLEFTYEGLSRGRIEGDDALVWVDLRRDTESGYRQWSQFLRVRREQDGWSVWHFEFGPPIPVLEFAEAMNENDPGSWRAAVDSESPLGEIDPERAVTIYEEVTIDELQVAAADGDEATLETDVTAHVRNSDETQHYDGFDVKRSAANTWQIADTSVPSESDGG